MILYSTNNIKNDSGETVNLSVSGVEQDELKVINNNTEILLEDMLKELKKQNFHLSMLTDNTISNEDLN